MKDCVTDIEDKILTITKNEVTNEKREKEMKENIKYDR